ncbi:PAS domain S-box-containing protein/diguanylate cyclase (GGDEF) domain-containing protein [Geoalkalibacter ferrihydriticus]|uniref:PAS domain S-box-containing protein/diguanylate cyclase (GGDEF) domain-containing protein n=1 Tax=Geoalkalibacter ferrihydriticus TaxID=392333 RepID=A0A1G9J2J5_9BACT|nr:EAL domain-containing protein [Geoalkalibacter ferrihydriticus]SDL31443.1 PAS domain S-box-containing protein/diguanylate cyclase (GGDEF) domain-containing protein [Geoalkalibacter ferrihydriticus]
MKVRIIISLSLLFLVYMFGILVSINNANKTTAALNHLLNLHKVEELRSSLVQRVMRVNFDLYTVHTPYSAGLDRIVDNVESLDELARNCNSCHHAPATVADLNYIVGLIDEFKTALSFYITTSADHERMERLKLEASQVGDVLLAQAQVMAQEASRGVARISAKAFVDIERSKNTLFALVFSAGLFGLLIAVHLARSITRPTRDLVAATRRITDGEFGYTIPRVYREEFGQLAGQFNAMSTSLKNSYAKLEAEIAERRQAEKALRDSEERYALAARGANDGLWDWDLAAGTIYFSARWNAMLGYAEQGLGSDPQAWFALVHPDDRQGLEAKIAFHLDGTLPHVENEQRLRHRDGTWRWMLTRGIAVRDEEGRPYRMAGSQTDITERKKTEEQLVHDAFHDALTELPNRALFANRVEHAIQAAERRKGFLFAVLFLDLDRFKSINDSLGHFMGDQLLIAVGRRLGEYLRPSDTVARLGGDEFAILLEDIHDGDEAVAVARRIQKDLPQAIEIGGHEVFTSASIGIALSSRGYAQPDQMLRDADLAMYHAKSRGKARYEIFDTSMHDHALEHLQLENDLRRGVERREFRLCYQPVIELAGERLTGFEALIRWHHPSRGVILPTQFIPLAEETGLLPPIGRWVLREACRSFAHWRRLGDGDQALAVSVNLASCEFTPALVVYIRGLLEEFDLPADALRLEITERTIMGDPESAAALLAELKDLGVGLQIDDFGTGYSSLGYLPHFPIDTLKIDRSFVAGIDGNKENFEIVRTIIALAKNLDLRVVGEGVESQGELQTLRELNCGFVQGKIYYPALDAAAAEALILAVQGKISRSN